MHFFDTCSPQLPIFNFENKEIITINFFLALPIVGYLHQLSPIKTSQRNNPYFDVQLQTQTDNIRNVCFSADKHGQFKHKFESSSPVKITNYTLKRNNRTKACEIHINKRTRLEEPNAEEVNFDIQQQTVIQIMLVMDIAQVLETSQAQVSIIGKVKLHGPVETVTTKSKVLKKQEASITDDSASVRLVLWENDISKITDEGNGTTVQ